MVSVRTNNRAGGAGGVAMALTAACVGAAMLLAGCGDSSSPEASAVRQAAGFMKSAGEPRTTDKMYEEAWTEDNAQLIQQLKTRAAGGNIADYVQQNTAETDLRKAISTLQGALPGEMSSGMKLSLQAQLGAAQQQLSDRLAAEAYADIASLNEQMAGLQPLAQVAIQLLGEAEAIEAFEKSSKGGVTAADVENAKAQVAKAQKEVADAQAKIDGLQTQIDAKAGQARKIYADTDAAFTAAEALKGRESMTAGNKAMADRAAAEKLSTEAAILEPALAQAKAEQALASVRLADAQGLVKTLEESLSQSQKASKDRATLAVELRSAAVKVVGEAGDEKSLSGRLAAFAKVAAGLSEKIQAAAKAAEQAAGSFGAAASSLATSNGEVKTIVDTLELEPGDPLRKVIADERHGAVLVWSQSAARQQAGRLNLAGVHAAELVAGAMELGKKTQAKVELAALDRAAFAGQAAENFDTAVKLAQSVNSRGAPNGDLDRIKWMGLSLEATALQGKYLAGDSAAKTEAATAKTNAVSRNPALAAQLSGIGQ